MERTDSLRRGKRLILLDIDGTLTDMGGNTPPPSALEALRQAKANGHLLALCTGRNYGMLSPLLQYGFDGVAASAGGYVLWGDQVLYDCPMTADQQRRAMEVFSRSGVSRTVEGRTSSYSDEGFMAFFQQAMAPGREHSELMRWRRQMERDMGILPFSQYQGEPLYKIVFLCHDESQLAEPRRELEAEFNFCMQGVMFGLLHGELINRKFHKGAAVERICAHLGISREDTVAFGDSMNDLEMIKTAGLGVCMGNGDPLLKERAGLVCPPVDQDGLFRGFQACGLI